TCSTRSSPAYVASPQRPDQAKRPRHTSESRPPEATLGPSACPHDENQPREDQQIKARSTPKVTSGIGSEMCVNLASEARAKGDIRDSERFRQAAADGLEEYLLAIITGRSEFHRQKYGTADRWAALAKLTASKVRRHLWGYRRSWIVVLRNWLALVLVGFPLWFYGVREGIKRNNRPAEVADIWLASLANALPGSRISDVTFVSTAAQIAALSEVLVSVLFGGLTAALLFRSIFERA
ncbi:MAG: hypothetical protein LC775_07460, partial [Acidobacteria bacterium]|nr:hypothetical protein [Acidobacteriota bacterium]